MLLNWLRRRRRQDEARRTHAAEGRSDPGMARDTQEEGAIPRPEIWFFGGKGGVGKTSCAAAQALALAEKGEATLLVSTDPAHNLGDLFGAVGGKPCNIAPRLDVMELDPERECDRYLEAVRQRIAPLVSGERSATVMRQLELSRHAPGTSEAALFDALVEIILTPPAPLEDEASHYRHILFDTAPSGHTIRLLSLPEVLGGWLEGMLGQRRRAVAERSLWLDSQQASETPGGEAPEDPISEALEQRRTRYAALRQRLSDTRRARVILVSTPEKLPCLETTRTREALEAHGLAVGGLIINQCLPEPAAQEAGKTLSATHEPQADWVATWREQQQRWAARLEEAFADRPCLRLLRQPQLPEDRASLAPLVVQFTAFRPWSPVPTAPSCGFAARAR
ncbi:MULTISPECIES: ArsA family ATPase [unclassified Cobetia]|uniref:ArsA family ATPase n=1 Tax=unclassified Cobetia TaxID=2609414 RepID=UPI00159D05A9|nr:MULTISPECIES: TRC40/GET3/ArsA family transport-energizing ATPase [unclassified Cobetia]MCO7232311.1 TRC40/GET3/ArsA family transport-energizing ATPase [Cobetia sp. Dlab-2-AX]MCO7235312.1 TRC40/GET3/ArsA family transport-energizing ATPase [Cobetia sp. Dlab-2-U]NVN55118.1 AAA family ATPase [bacterium Scap17]